ncbi:MAG: metallophosphoesterase [Gammaproteobacteria bacterium]|nr:metallophosphoesterase [Gammaproteobacteria bacterium]
MPYIANRHFTANLIGRDYVVGDIHGEFSLLEHSLQLLNFDTKKDRIFSVGDLIDRGPESARVIEFLDSDWFYAILGNHELMAMDAATDGDIFHAWTHANGGDWWLDIPAHAQNHYLDAFKALPLTLEVDTPQGVVGLVHANVPFSLSWPELVARVAHEDIVRANVLWSRQRYHRRYTGSVAGIDWVFCGHTPTEQMLQLGNVFYIDTGACYGGGLTIFPLDQLPLTAVKALA